MCHIVAIQPVLHGPAVHESVMKTGAPLWGQSFFCFAAGLPPGAPMLCVLAHFPEHVFEAV